MAEKFSIVLMAKQPQRGKVKTRLAKSIGKTEALRFFKFCFGKMLRTISHVPGANGYVSIAPDKSMIDTAWREQQPFANLPGINWFAQGGGNLGDRLITAMNLVPAGPVIIIGSDCPDITCDDLKNAGRLLRHNEFVLGPAHDGGYWLIGFAARARRKKVFQNIRWSTEFALEDTLLQMQGDRVGFLPTKTDVDTIDEYNAFKNQK